MKAKRGRLPAKAALADTDIGPTRLSLWETAKEEIGIEGLLKLAVAYSCPVDDFLGGIDDQYDRIIERRIAPDARQFYEPRIKQLEAAFARLVRQLTGDDPAPAPHTAPSAAEIPSSAGKSKATRARQTQTRKHAPKRGK